MLDQNRELGGTGASGSTLAPSLWSATAIPLDAQPELAGELKCDVAIVGAGFTGLRAALELARAGHHVAVLEAMEVGYGASGRSGGQVNPVLRMTPDEVMSEIGLHNGERLVAETLNSGNDLFEDIRKYGIDCDPVQKGWLQVAHSPAAMKGLLKLRESWNAVGGQITALDREACREWSGSSDFVGGLYHPSAGHVQPLSLVRGFARAALQHGARIFERSAVTSATRSGGKWILGTSRGRIIAEKVIIATNGYTGDLWPGLKRTIVPLVSLQAATEPLPPELRQKVMPRETTISDTRRAIIYGRYDRYGRLSIGCMGSYEDRPDSFGGFKRLKAGTERIFPALKGIRWQYKWGGRIAMTTDFLPHLHEPAPGLLIGLGFNGRGVAMTSVMGRALAAKVIGTAHDDLPFPVRPIKAIPLHRILAALIPAATPLLAAADRMDRMKQ